MTPGQGWTAEEEWTEGPDNLATTVTHETRPATTTWPDRQRPKRRQIIYTLKVMSNRWRQSGRGGLIKQVCALRGSQGRTPEEGSEDKIKQEVKIRQHDTLNHETDFSVHGTRIVETSSISCYMLQFGRLLWLLVVCVVHRNLASISIRSLT